ncbi:MAG: hypothetical protein HKN25_17220 [Pyrinomonadaceae bacterium]|nr:hypothetical protein [Pyrinomonadaceae bacterium]
MSESKIDENLIATLEMSLRQTRNAQKRLQMQLRELENEADTLREEIEAMDKGAEQTEAAIHSLLAAINSGNQSRNVMKGLSIDEDYQLPDDLNSSTRRNRRIPNERPPSRYRQREYRRDEFREDSVAYLSKNRGSSNSARNIEPLSDRFSDRTITQACTLLLRETGEALHVNELYNLLVEGGFEFKGNNPTISIAVSLNRNTRFRKVAPGTFDLVIRDASQTGS